MDQNDQLDENVFNIDMVEEPQNLKDVICSLMVNPNLSMLNYFNDFGELAPKSQSELSNNEEDYRVISLDNGKTLLAMSTHATNHHLGADPKTAVEILISRAVRRMVCMGGTPKAITAMLYHINYADPVGSSIASEARHGIESAAKAYKLQIADAKMRFDYFGELDDSAHTVIVSLLGTFSSGEDGNAYQVTPSFKEKGNNIFMLGRSSNDLASSEYIEFYHGIDCSPMPEFNLDFEVELQDAIKELIDQKLIDSASPVGRGGLFFSLLRAGWKNALGFDITTDAEVRRDSFLFGEAMGRMIVGVDESKEDAFVDYLLAKKIPFFALGHVTRGEMRIDDESFGFIDKTM